MIAKIVVPVGYIFMISFILSLFSSAASAQEETGHYPTIQALQKRVVELMREEPRIKSAKRSREEGVIDWTSSEPGFEDIDAQTYVGNLFAHIQEMNKEEIEKELRIFVENGISAFAPVPLDPAKLFASIRPKEWLGADEAVTNASSVTKELTEDAVIILFHDRDGGYSSVSWEEIGGREKQDQYFQVAQQNNEKLLEQMGSIEKENFTVYFLNENPVLAAALLLTDGFRKIATSKYPDGFLLALPNTEDVLVVDRGVEGAVERARKILKGISFNSGKGAVSSSLFEYRDGQLVEVKE